VTNLWLAWRGTWGRSQGCRFQWEGPDWHCCT